MFSEYEPLFSPRPFWFLTPELLIQVRRAEIEALAQLLANHSDFRNLFDSADATVTQRSVCFQVLTRVGVVQTIDEMFIASYEPSPPLSDAEVNTLRRTRNLVADDAPDWVSEMNRVVQQLPTHINAALPDPLRAGGYRHDDAERNSSIEAAVGAFRGVDQVQALIQQVLDEQLQRLVRRWSATTRRILETVQVLEPGRREPKKRRTRRTRDKVRVNRDKMIAEIDGISPTIGEFLKVMDERNVRPQLTWSGWPGSWRKAYNDPRLKKLIHQDKSRALARVRRAREK
jgi:hypothetical protein